MTRKTLRHNQRLEIRPLTADYIMEFHGLSAMPYSARGYAFFLDGDLVGMGGVRFHGPYFIAFSDIKENVKVEKATVYRCALEVMKLIRDMGIKTVAICNNDVPSAPKFLAHLGYHHSHSDPAGEFYVHG